MAPRLIVAATFALAALSCGDDSAADPSGTTGATSGMSSDSGAAGGTESSTGSTPGDTSSADGTTGDGSSTAASSTSESGEQPVYPLDDVLRLHHVQVKGTHNSYHIEPALPFDPSHEYTHAPLDVQLDSQGVRAFELDIHEQLDGSLAVYHIAAVDPQTTCRSFNDCLTTIQGWSETHPGHMPIMVWLEIKDTTGGVPIDDLDMVDSAIRGVFSDAQLLEPDDVRGDYPTLQAAVSDVGWPTLGEVRDTVMFVVLDGEHGSGYSQNYATVAGRAMFVRVGAEHFDSPVAAIAKLGSSDQAGIDAAHAANLLIATNVCSADESDESCYAQFETARNAGIHMLKDDIPAMIPEREYWMDLDGSPARCNPVTAPERCTSEAIEAL